MYGNPLIVVEMLARQQAWRGVKNFEAVLTYLRQKRDVKPDIDEYATWQAVFETTWQARRAVRLAASAQGGKNRRGKTSEAQKRASRENGKKYGGRPKAIKEDEEITLPF